MRTKLAVFLTLIAGLTMGLGAPEAGATPAAGDFEFTMSVRLPSYPCPGGCTPTILSSNINGAGTAEGGTTATATAAAFTVVGGTVGFGTGTTYTEPGPPICPSVGSAAGTISMTSSGSQVSGVVYRPQSAPFVTGSVTQVKLTAAFTYQRVGVNAAITLLNGSVQVWYFIPGVGSSSFTTSATAGGGTAVFSADALRTVDLCQHYPPGGSLDVTIAGDVAFGG